MENRLLVELVACGVGTGPTLIAVIFREHACVGHCFFVCESVFAPNGALVCTSQVIDRFLKLTRLWEVNSLDMALLTLRRMGLSSCLSCLSRGFSR